MMSAVRITTQAVLVVVLVAWPLVAYATEGGADPLPSKSVAGRSVLVTIFDLTHTETLGISIAFTCMAMLGASLMLCRTGSCGSPGAPVLYKPCVVRGKHSATNDEFMQLVEQQFKQNLRDYKQQPEEAVAKARHISTKTMGIERRYFCRRIEDLNIPLSPQEQANLFIEHGLEMAVPAIHEALSNAGVEQSDIGCVLFVSHSPFPFPPFTAYLMSKMAFKRNCVQIPVNAMGCAGGGFAFRSARDYLLAHPDDNVLILSVELCSLGFRPHSKGMSWFLNSALFGDAASAAVVRGSGSRHPAPKNTMGLAITHSKQRLVPNTMHVSYFKYSEWGYDFVTTEELCTTVRNHCPGFATELCEEAFDKKQPKDITLTVIRPGGAKMIQDASSALGLTGTWSHHAALQSMADGGNLASSTIIDMVAKAWGKLKSGDEVVAMGMGPGFVMDGVAMRAVGVSPQSWMVAVRACLSQAC